jgi:hypothetical protein
MRMPAADIARGAACGLWHAGGMQYAETETKGTYFYEKRTPARVMTTRATGHRELEVMLLLMLLLPTPRHPDLITCTITTCKLQTKRSSVH